MDSRWGRAALAGVASCVLAVMTVPATSAVPVGAQQGLVVSLFDDLPSARKHGPGQFMGLAVSPSPTGGVIVGGTICLDNSYANYGDPICTTVDATLAGSLKKTSTRWTLKITGTKLGTIDLVGRTGSTVAQVTHCFHSYSGLQMAFSGVQPTAVVWSGRIGRIAYRPTTYNCNRSSTETALAWAVLAPPVA